MAISSEKFFTAKFIWMDGKFIAWKDAKIHILTHALHYGSAAFEGIRSYKARKGIAVFRLDKHIDRFFYSANALSMKLKLTKNQLKNAIKNLIKINNLGDAYIRPIAYYGYGNLSVFPKDVKTNVAIIAIPSNKYYPQTLRVMISTFARHNEKSTIRGTKISGNYANSLLAMFEARKKGYDEALMLDYGGFVSEGPAKNIFLVRDGKLITPSSKSALHGITMESILEISRDLGIEAYKKKVTLSDFMNSDELFFCGTLTEVAPIISIDGKKIGTGKIGKITSMLKGKFYNIARGNEKIYEKWLTYV